MSKENTSSLDTLAQLSSKNEKMRKIARAKYVTRYVIMPLIDVASPLQKSYWNTYHCANLFQVKSGVAKPLIAITINANGYCKNRWCYVCNRIATAKNINGYLPIVKEWIDEKTAWFVTLTQPTVEKFQLPAQVDEMHNIFKAIRKQSHQLYKRGNISWDFQGIRKLEITYRPHSNRYHPHYHCLVRGKEAADWLIDQWLQRVPTANIKAQDCRLVNERGTIELFKYVSKVIQKSKGKSGKFEMYPQALDWIYQSIRGKRIFQPFGIKRSSVAIAEDELESLLTDVEDGIYSWNNTDWKRDGVGLSNYSPSENIVSFIKDMQIFNENT